MPTVKHPLLSLDASGRLATLLGYVRGPGRAKVRRLPRPVNPRSPAQRQQRAYLSWCQRSWSGLSPAEQATWAPFTVDNLPLYQGYVRANARHARNADPMSAAFPPTTGPSPPDPTAPATYSQLKGQAGIRWTDAIWPTLWATAALLVDTINPSPPDPWIDGVIAAGVQHYESYHLVSGRLYQFFLVSLDREGNTSPGAGPFVITPA